MAFKKVSSYTFNYEFTHADRENHLREEALREHRAEKMIEQFGLPPICFVCGYQDYSVTWNIEEKKCCGTCLEKAKKIIASEKEKTILEEQKRNKLIERELQIIQQNEKIILLLETLLEKITK